MLFFICFNLLYNLVVMNKRLKDIEDKLKNIETFSHFTNSDEKILEDNSEIGIYKLTKFFTKTVYSSKVAAFVIIFSPMLVALGLGAMMPIHLAVGASQVFVTLLSAGTLWGMTYFSIRRTTFYKNLSTTRIKTIKVYLGIYLTMLLVTLCSEISFWTITIFLDLIGMNSVVAIIFGLVSENSHNIEWLKVDWFTLAYTWLASVTLMFLACFATRNIFNLEATFFFVLATYILLLIPFGGIIPPTPEHFKFENGMVVLEKDLTLFTVTTLLFPQYHLNLFNFVSVWAGTTNDSISMGGFTWLSSFHWSDSSLWNYTILMPIASGVLLIIWSSLTLNQK